MPDEPMSALKRWEPLDAGQIAAISKDRIERGDRGYEGRLLATLQSQSARIAELERALARIATHREGEICASIARAALAHPAPGSGEGEKA